MTTHYYCKILSPTHLLLHLSYLLVFFFPFVFLTIFVNCTKLNFKIFLLINFSHEFGLKKLKSISVSSPDVSFLLPEYWLIITHISVSTGDVCVFSLWLFIGICLYSGFVAEECKMLMNQAVQLLLFFLTSAVFARCRIETVNINEES